MARDRIEGGCLCGGIRYDLARVPTDVAHCHCRICRRSAGAPFLTWATVARADLTVIGELSWFRSSTLAKRGFCPTCGTQLFFAQEVVDAKADAGTTALPLADAPPASPTGAETIDVTVASLDEPDRVHPTRNIWVGSRLAFLHGFDATLPDHPDEGET